MDKKKEIKLIVFDADKFQEDLIRIIRESNAICISRQIPYEISTEIIKTAIQTEKNDKGR